MGNGATSEPKKDPLEGYQLYSRENNNEKMGQMMIYKKQGSEDTLWVKNDAFDSDEMEAYLSAYIQKDQFLQDFYSTVQVKPVRANNESTFGMCTSCNSLSNFSVICKPAFRDLANEILSRANDVNGAEFFNEPEVWYILERIIDVEMFLSKFPRRVHGNLRLTGILLDSTGR